MELFALFSLNVQVPKCRVLTNSHVTASGQFESRFQLS